jgi:CRISPR/Cas system CSM-associated protein Csm2 small subunit
MTSAQWYRKFYNSYKRDRAIRRLENNGQYDKEGKWTPAIMDLLRRMGESLTYEVSEERPVAGGGRSDQRWVKEDASLVYIEHENRCDKRISGEIEKLCNDVSKLKVLITYVADRGFTENVQKLLNKVRQAIDAHKITFTGELLLVVSGYHESDWVAFGSILRPRMVPIKRRGSSK